MVSVTDTENMKKPIELLWRDFGATRSDEMREKLLFHYLSLVQQIAGRIIHRLPANVSIDDLIDAGVVGLLESIDRYDASNNVKFETFAFTRVRGAIIDELRKMDWAPRSIRGKSKQVERARKELEIKLGRVPGDPEIADHLNLTIEQYTQMQREIDAVTKISLDGEISVSEGKPGTLHEFLSEKDVTTPLQKMEDEEQKQFLVKAIESLPQTEKLVIALYYYEELTLKEIGEVLQLSESRVSQIHSKVIANLKIILGK